MTTYYLHWKDTITGRELEDPEDLTEMKAEILAHEARARCPLHEITVMKSSERPPAVKRRKR